MKPEEFQREIIILENTILQKEQAIGKDTFAKKKVLGRLGGASIIGSALGGISNMAYSMYSVAAAAAPAALAEGAVAAAPAVALAEGGGVAAAAGATNLLTWGFNASSIFSWGINRRSPVTGLCRGWIGLRTCL
jgi:hypothetical protein